MVRVFDFVVSGVVYNASVSGGVIVDLCAAEGPAELDPTKVKRGRKFACRFGGSCGVRV